MIVFLIHLLAFLSLIYILKILFFYFGLTRIEHGKNTILYAVSILIPARNEDANLQTCINSILKQDYPKEKIEIIIIDDDSTDNTNLIAQDLVSQHPFIKLIHLDKCPPGISPKKRALKTGIDAAQNEIILTIDADCWASPNWIRHMIAHFEPQIGLVAGYVAFSSQHEKTLFQKIQSLEFLGLTTVGIGSIGADDPIIANGANLGFRKSVFQEVNGYEGDDHIMSGDDDLFMQKIEQMTTWKIKACLSPDSFVFTNPAVSVPEFINQRIRWASKGLIYKKASLVLYLISVYLFYVLLFITVPYSIFNYSSFFHPLYFLIAKIGIDFIFILKGTAITGRKDLRKYFLIAEIFQIPYIILVGFLGVFRNFSWKGR